MLTVKDLVDKHYVTTSEQRQDLLRTIGSAQSVTESFTHAWFIVFATELKRRVGGLYAPTAIRAKEEILKELDKLYEELLKEAEDIVIGDKAYTSIERNRKLSFHRIAKLHIKRAIESEYPVDDVTRWTRYGITKHYKATIGGAIRDSDGSGYVRALTDLAKIVRNQIENRGIKVALTTECIDDLLYILDSELEAPHNDDA